MYNQVCLSCLDPSENTLMSSITAISWKLLTTNSNNTKACTTAHAPKYTPPLTGSHSPPTAYTPQHTINRFVLTLNTRYVCPTMNCNWIRIMLRLHMQASEYRKG